MSMLKLGKYQHYKGGLYEVIGVATHSETDEDMVVYKALYDGGKLWTRPLDIFSGDVYVDGEKRSRFVSINE